MTEKRTIIVDGAPMGKERPRATSFGGHARIYTPKKTQNYEGRFASEWRAKYPELEPVSTAIEVSIVCVFPLLKSDYKKDGNLTASGFRKIRNEEKPTKKPDLDNIAKAVLDGLNGIAFVDDSQIVKLTISKAYGQRPRVEFNLTEAWL